MTENWVVIAACFTSSVLSSLTAWAITWALANKKIDSLQREVKVYKASLASKEEYLNKTYQRATSQEKILDGIQELLYGVPK